ncbi:cell division protein FtsQ/DivIB [Actinoplanes sp. TFC3]|uniref:cell division protein FtsQ/DivIB n=1 Tax=Actinoplanes sp. TFC3 TaxID=1710355 RepID=UPI0008371C9F|nr:FtsQ-type POTRA domain-containing protein [Actinoplanes sp. TFC3]
MSEGRNWRLVRADTDAVPPSVRRFMARARQRRLQAALPWAIALGVVLVLGGLTWMVYGTSVLGVRQVKVVGTQTLSAEQVQQAAAVRPDEPLARVDLDQVRSQVQALPAVERAIVSRGWPSTLEVQVVERTAVAAVPVGKQFSLLDAEGVAFRTVADRPSGLPVANLATPGPADINTRSALVVLGSLTDELREQVLSVSVPAPAQVQLGLRKGRTVIWGDETQSETKAQVATALLQRKGDTIDVSAPTVVTIR